jgi:hypothetical protein
VVVSSADVPSQEVTERALEPEGSDHREPSRTAALGSTAAPGPVLAVASHPSSETNVLGYAFAAGAVGSAALFGYFELEGQARYREMDAGCGRTHSCSPGDIDSTRTDFVLAGSFLAATVVCAGISAWQFLRPRGQTPAAGSAPRFLAGPTPTVMLRF